MNFIAAAFHDGVLLYAQALNETLERGGSVTNASAVTHQMWNRTFYGEPHPRNPPPPSGAACQAPTCPASMMIFWDWSWRDGDLCPQCVSLSPRPSTTPHGPGSAASPPTPCPPSPGVTGFLKIDENGDRESDYSLWDMDPLTGDFQVTPAQGQPVPRGVGGPHPTHFSSLLIPQDRGQLQRHHQEDPDGAGARDPLAGERGPL